MRYHGAPAKDARLGAKLRRCVSCAFGKFKFLTRAYPYVRLMTHTDREIENFDLENTDVQYESLRFAV